MQLQILDNLDSDQELQEIQIQVEDQSLNLKNVRMGQVMNTLQQKLSSMASSNFYKEITVHLGAKSKQPINYLQEHYERKEEILKLELEQEKEYLKQIIEASDEEYLKILEKQHQLNQCLIDKKRAQIKYPNFIPCLYVDAKRKNSIYGSLNQSFDRRGVGNFSAKIGYRSPFLKYDALQLNLEWPISSFRKRYYQTGLEWLNPIKDDENISFSANASHEAIFKGIDTENKSLSLGLRKGDNKYSLQFSYRKPYITDNIEKYCFSQFYRPSRKIGLKYSRVFENSIHQEDITLGLYSQLRAELGIPTISQSSYLRLQYQFRKFFDTFHIRNLLDNELAKKFFWKSTFETNFSTVILSEFGRHKYVNDVLQAIQLRGYDNKRQPSPSFANMKGSLKFNLHNFPVLHQARIVSFLYAQAGLAFLKENPFKPLCIASTGLGFSFALGPLAQVELLCVAAHRQSLPAKEPINFQVRFAACD